LKFLFHEKNHTTLDMTTLLLMLITEVEVSKILEVRGKKPANPV